MAVIPARGGSKGIPRKNVLPLAGRPLIEWTIRAAREANTEFDAIIVSTDNDEIAEVARAAGAQVPFQRPADLATDEASTLAVLQHAVDWMEQERQQPFEWILTLQPTSPLRQAQDVDAVIGLAERYDSDCDSVISVVERSGEHPRLAKYQKDGYLVPFVGESLEGVRRQDCHPPALFNNGALYLTRRNVLMDGGQILGQKAVPYVMPVERSIDIDSPVDFKLADLLLKESLA